MLVGAVGVQICASGCTCASRAARAVMRSLEYMTYRDLSVLMYVTAGMGHLDSGYNSASSAKQ